MSLREQIVVEAMFNQLDRTNKQIADLMIENPHCLDGNPRKGEVIQMLVVHLEAKKERCSSVRNGNANGRNAIMFAMMLEDLDEAPQELKREFACKIAKKVCNAGMAELEYLPEDIKNRIFIVAIQYFAET